MREFLFTMLALMAAICLQAHAQPKTQEKSQPDPLKIYLQQEMQRRGIPGLQIAVVQHGKIVQLGAYGFANLEHSVSVTETTVFSIASITKCFTGVAIIQLVEEGKLDLAAPVSRYLDGLPAAWQAVTIQQLLTHASGIPDIVDPNAGKLVVDGNPDAAWAKIQPLPMEFTPGERFSYNQTNYVLLGQIIAKLSGKPFSQFIAERQFNVVGMPQSRFGDFAAIVPNRAQPYYYLQRADEKGVRTNTLGNVFYESALFLLAGNGINTTAKQLANWVIAVQQGRLFKTKTSLKTLWTPGVLNNGSLNRYAIGWRTMARPEHPAVGGTGGNWAAFFVYPKDDLSVVILTNLSGANPESFIDEVAGYYIPDMRASTGFGLPPTIKPLHQELVKRGFGHVLEVVNEAKQKDAHFQLPEGDVNAWGYRLMGQGQLKDAIEIFKLNIRLYPESANAYDSLADACEAAGEKPLAIQNYTRSLALNPRNTHAMERLKELTPDGTEHDINAPAHNALRDTSTLEAKTMDAKIQALAQAYLTTRPDTALSIGITQEGKSQYFNFGSVSSAAGKTPQPANSDSVYEIGSLTKTFAGLLLAQAIAEHRVKPDDDVRKYLAGSYPNLEYGGEPIRLLHLANMTSGLPDNLPDLSALKSADGKETDVWAKTKVLSAYTKEEFFKDLHSVKLTAKPGNDPSHSNVAGQLLGYVLEKVYGAPFEALVARYIEKPLAMSADTSPAKVTIGHDEHGSVMPALTMESAKAAGGLRYSAADMLRYLRHQIAEASQAVVTSHQANWYTLDHKLALGYFWIIEAPESQDRRFRYSGGTFGFSSFCDFYPARKLGLVLLSNQSDRKAQDDLQKLSEAIAAALHR